MVPVVCSLVKESFRCPTKVEEINETLIMLIPKVNNPSHLKQFKPISLCNVVYKIITKVIAQQLRVYMSQLIAPNQCSFILGHHLSDNIIIAQEIFHSMRNVRGKNSFY